MTHRADPYARLIRLLAASAAHHGVTIDLLDCRERPWSSVTFTGHRLTFDLAISERDCSAWLTGLPEEDLPIPRFIVADLVVRPSGAVTILEILLLDA